MNLIQTINWHVKNMLGALDKAISTSADITLTGSGALSVAGPATLNGGIAGNVEDVPATPGFGLAGLLPYGLHYNLIYGDGTEGGTRLSGEVKKSLDYLTSPPGLFDYYLQLFPLTGIYMGVFHQELCITKDISKRVVDFVCRSGCKKTYCSQFLCLPHSLFSLLLLGHIYR